MLNCNLWTSKGMVNGAQGVVKKIWFDQRSNAHSEKRLLSRSKLVKTLKGLAFHTCFDHAQLKKPKETDIMLMLKKDTEHCDLLGFQQNTYGMDLSEYTLSED